jgi:hypothetical protein
MVIPKPLLIAGGLAAAGGAAWFLFKGKGDKPAEGEGAPTDPAAAGAGGMTPTAGTDPAAGGLTPTGTATPGAAGPGVGGTGSGALAGGQQVGPYTVIPDPQSGQMIVFETATEQPVGILDAQGNLVPLDGAGAPGAGAGTGGVGTGGVGPGAGTIVPEGPGLTPTGTTSSVPQAQAGAGQYKALAQDLFANAGNGAVGSASSDAMAGQTNLAPAAGMQAGATSSTGLGAGTGGAASGSGGVTSQQVGAYTLLDDGSGTKVVLDTASQQPVAMMDAAGNITPISVDAAGNVSVAGAGTGAASLGGTPSAGAGVGMVDASAGAGSLTSSPMSSVSSPAMVSSPAATSTSPAAISGIQ